MILYLEKFAFWMVLFPYFFQRLCPSGGIPFRLRSTPGLRRWYTTTTLVFPSSSASITASLQGHPQPAMG